MESLIGKLQLKSDLLHFIMKKALHTKLRFFFFVCDDTEERFDPEKVGCDFGLGGVLFCFPKLENSLRGKALIGGGY